MQYAKIITICKRRSAYRDERANATRTPPWKQHTKHTSTYVHHVCRGRNLSIFDRDRCCCCVPREHHSGRSPGDSVERFHERLYLRFARVCIRYTFIRVYRTATDDWHVYDVIVFDAARWRIGRRVDRSSGVRVLLGRHVGRYEDWGGTDEKQKRACHGTGRRRETSTSIAIERREYGK